MNLAIKIIFLLVFLAALISLVPGIVVILLSLALTQSFAPQSVKDDLQGFFENLGEIFS